jgi:hypothetical protein
MPFTMPSSLATPDGAGDVGVKGKHKITNPLLHRSQGAWDGLHLWRDVDGIFFL